MGTLFIGEILHKETKGGILHIYPLLEDIRIKKIKGYKVRAKAVMWQTMVSSFVSMYDLEISAADIILTPWR